MNPKKTAFNAYAAVLFLTLAGAASLASNSPAALATQTSQQPPPIAPRTSSNPGNSNQQPPLTPGQEGRARNACFARAGISKDVLNQRRSIMQQTRSQIESICSNSSLTNSEKQAQMRQAREDARKQIAGDITPEQENAIVSCQRGAEPSTGEGHQNPCGGTNPGNGSAPVSNPRSNPPNGIPASNSPTAQPYQ
jgi:hypothetical protein